MTVVLSWRQNGAMPSIQIKGVSPEAHAVLRARAANAHQSLQEYLLRLLEDEASTPTLDEVLDRIERRSGGSLTVAEAVEAVRADRDSR